MSNSTSTSADDPTTPASSKAQSPTTSPLAPSSTISSISSTKRDSSSVANTSSPPAPSTTPTASTTPPTSLTPSTEPTTQPPTTSTTPDHTTSETPPPSSTNTPPPQTSVITSIRTTGGVTSTIVHTSTAPPGTTQADNTGASATSSSASATLQPGGKSSGSSGLHGGGLVAVAVVVPIVAVALIVAAAIFFWRKRKQRKDAEELRRKEVEEYGYNPNNDPTLPAVGGTAEGPFEMREEGSSGYRGWGTTAVSSGRKASTTLSGGQSAGGIGMAYSDSASPHGGTSDTRSDNPLMGERPISGETEALGAMGPATTANRGADINRGPSNASSSYSAANRSDGSGEVGGPGGGQYYSNQYDTGNPYNNGDGPYGSPPGRAEMAGQPVIRDVQARRNTRIENPAHFPQQSAGIAQNF
ncbi:uncharacterized protein BP5553_03450 [Venustampulla echinocandica]|uniref:Uncharacterized protein n=1 Tax=Venustampulla echinocandica TaxID=2656787 RepID=A0A370TUC5_9HELO|nr:uncharacterized protein BP5553_03450 [Venustampulla echinocandica]RDL39110.1 hypothetical protein BP5553_03450 [Venustampulla echinocandica]